MGKTYTVATVGDVSTEDTKEEEPDLEIHETFLDLVPLESLVLDTSLVALEDGEEKDALVFSKTLGGDGTVGEEEEYNESPSGTEGTNDKEFVLPGGEGALDVANGVAEETTKGHANAGSTEPDTDAERLLATGVPHTSDEHKGRVCAGFSSTTKDTEDGKGLKGVACGLDHEQGAPEEDVDAEILANGELEHKVVCREGPEEKAKVEEGGKPAVAAAGELEIGHDAKDGSVGEGSLVDVEEDV